MDRKGGIETRDQRFASEALRQWTTDTGMVDIWHMLTALQKELTKKEINSLLRRRSEFLMHKTKSSPGNESLDR